MLMLVEVLRWEDKMKQKKLPEIIVYENIRVRVEIYHDRLISTKEAKETAVKMIEEDENVTYE